MYDGERIKCSKQTYKPKNIKKCRKPLQFYGELLLLSSLMEHPPDNGHRIQEHFGRRK